MSVMIQIRNVPDDVHRQLKARAALAGMSLSDYLLGEARLSLSRLTTQQIEHRLAQRRPVRARRSAVELLREERDRGGRGSQGDRGSR
jgi:plasmid stability protein